MDSLHEAGAHVVSDRLRGVSHVAGPGLGAAGATVEGVEAADVEVAGGRRRPELSDSESAAEGHRRKRRRTRPDDDDVEILEVDESGTPVDEVPEDLSDEEPVVLPSEEQEEDVKVLSEEDQIKAQQVIEIEDEEEDVKESPSSKNASDPPVEIKKAASYVCPICMEPPVAALVTKCGHIFCTTCLYGMVNSSKGNGRRNGVCALCRENVRLQDVRLIIMRKQRVRKVD